MSEQEKKEYYSGHVQIPFWVIKECGFKLSDLLIYSMILSFSREKQGRFYGSLNWLAERSGLSKSSVQRSLKYLTQNGYLDKVELDVKGVKMCEYSAIIKGRSQNDHTQVNQVEIESQDEYGRSQNDHEPVVSLTTNNILNNKVNNISNKTMSEIEISDFESENDKKYFEVAKAFHDLFLKNLKVKKVPTKKLENTNAVKFIAQIRLMYERDDYTDEQFRDVFKFLNSPKGEFWTTNILSTTKLREKFTTLLLQNGRKQASTQDNRSDGEKTESAVRNYYSDLAEGAKEGQRG